MSADFGSALTVLTFVSGGASVPYGGRETQLSLRAKAATLFERATHLASQWSASELSSGKQFSCLSQELTVTPLAPLQQRI